MLRRLNVGIFIGGGTAGGARDATVRAINEGAEALVSFGLAGGLSPHLKPGFIIIPDAVLTGGRRIAADDVLSAALGGRNTKSLLGSGTVVASVRGKAECRASTGADAVDLESGAVAEAASQAGLPFAVLRAICDPAGRALPPAAMVALNQAGSISPLRVAASLLRHPGQIPSLLALSRDAAAARSALAHRVAELAENASLAPWIRRRA